MSTRATYEIGDLTFYVHHDGYPAGAAAKFADMIGAMTVSANGRGIDAIADRRGGACFAFIRGNMNAEPTESHQAHGDTEYRWKISESAGALLVSHQARSADFERWSAWSSPQPLEEFINRHQPGAVVSLPYPSEYVRRTLYATTENAVKIAAEYRRQAAKFQAGNPNKAGNEKHADAWERAALEQIPARVRWLEAQKAEAALELAKLDERGSDWGRPYYQDAKAEAERELEALRVPIGELEAA